MSKTVTELEPADIRLKTDDDEGDPMHDAVSAAALVATIRLTLAKKGSDPEELLRSATASFLNTLDRSGFVVVKREVI